jgi:hypothetical protein
VRRLRSLPRPKSEPPQQDGGNHLGISAPVGNYSEQSLQVVQPLPFLRQLESLNLLRLPAQPRNVELHLS